MDSSNWRPSQADQAPPIDGGDWRSQLQHESRQRIVNKIMDTLKRHLPFSGNEGLQELRKIAIRFEEKVYSAATSQSDYLRKISLKMLTMQSKSQTDALPSNSGGGGSRNPQDPASLDSTAQAGGTNAGDWQEEVYQMIKVMKDSYFADLSEMYCKISIKLRESDSHPQPPETDQLEKLRLFKQMLEKLIQFLQLTKSTILPGHKEKLPSFEKQIINLLSSNTSHKTKLDISADKIEDQMCWAAMSQPDCIQKIDNLKQAIIQATISEHTS